MYSLTKYGVLAGALRLRKRLSLANKSSNDARNTSAWTSFLNKGYDGEKSLSVYAASSLEGANPHSDFGDLLLSEFQKVSTPDEVFRIYGNAAAIYNLSAANRGSKGGTAKVQQREIFHGEGVSVKPAAILHDELLAALGSELGTGVVFSSNYYQPLPMPALPPIVLTLPSAFFPS